MESNSADRSFQRQTAFKVRVSDILGGRYVKEDGWQPNFIENGSLRISRANIMGIAVDVSDEGSFKNVLLDDGSGRVALRIFDNLQVSVNSGDVLVVIGRPREFNGERYVVPEIVKKINPKWLEVRKVELSKDVPIVESTPVNPTTPKPEKTTVDKVKQDEESFEESPVDVMLGLIRKIDQGDGATFEDINKASERPDCEDFLNRLLELGEIFEVKPGRFKVLE